MPVAIVICQAGSHTAGASGESWNLNGDVGGERTALGLCRVFSGNRTAGPTGTLVYPTGLDATAA
jgi:hypothetical protein